MKRSSNRSVVTRLRALLLTAGLVLAGVVGVASPASADTGICSGYFGCVNSGHGDHGYGANSANSYWTMYPGHNCTNYAAFMAIKNGASSPPVNLGNADTWDTRAASYGVPVNGTPAVGAIAQWDAMHVAYVESVNSDGSITVSEDGYLGDYHWRIITHSGDWPDHFIHFADVSTAGGEMLWKLRNSNSEGPATAAFYYGPDTAKPVTGDWDGNGSVTIGVARNNGAGEIAWQLRNANSSGSPSATHAYGAPTDTPVVGNWDGVGTTTIGIVRNDGSGQLMWKLSNDNGTPYASFYYGASTDIPVVGDWDGNGSVTIGIARRDATSDQLIWKLRNSNSAGVADLSFYYGASTAIPVTGDWNADGVTTIGTARKDDGSGELLWQLRNSNDAGTPSYAFHYGGSFDTPIVGDWDNSGTTTIGIARG